jgi:hypothetical protein
VHIQVYRVTAIGTVFIKILIPITEVQFNM